MSRDRLFALVYSVVNKDIEQARERFIGNLLIRIMLKYPHFFLSVCVFVLVSPLVVHL